jgi:hypothetical protein
MFTSHLGFSSPVVRFRNFRAISLKLLAGIFAASALLVPRAAYANTYRVTNTSDNAADTGSLRHAVNTAVDGDTIQFSAGAIGTVTLTNGTLLISHSVTITGPGANVLTISGNNAVPVFTMYSSSSVSISGLTIANGNSATNGGGIYNNSGTWTVNNCAFYANTTAAGGGAIASSGTLAVSNSTFSGNTAVAGGAVSTTVALQVSRTARSLATARPEDRVPLFSTMAPWRSATARSAEIQAEAGFSIIRATL